MREDYGICSVCGKYKHGKCMNDKRDLLIYGIVHSHSGSEFKLDYKDMLVCWDCRNKMKKEKRKRKKK